MHKMRRGNNSVAMTPNKHMKRLNDEQCKMAVNREITYLQTMMTKLVSVPLLKHELENLLDSSTRLNAAVNGMLANYKDAQ